MYKITITKREPNPHFKEQLEEYNGQKGRMYSGNMDIQVSYPASTLELKALETTVTEAEFNAIRKACLEQM